MADFNQSPAGQVSTAIPFTGMQPIASSANPVWQVPAWPQVSSVGSVAIDLGAMGGAPSITMPAGLLGSVATVSSSTAPGIFTLNEQSAAKRLGAWP